jgi:transcriptional activator of cad operon
MRWRIEDYFFCDQQQTLTKDGTSTQLEPMVVELLAYFCQHPDEIISRDQLIDNVWQGRVITDNAVSKIVTKLRKVLDDDSKQPRFIATFPKKGYRFIANIKPFQQPVQQTTSTISHQAQVNLNKAFDNPRNLMVVILLLLAVMFTFKQVWSPEAKRQTITQVKALTRSAGQEAMPRISPDGSMISYGEFKDGKLHMWFKSLTDGRTIELSHGEAPDVWVGPASWNRAGTKIVYLVTTKESCQYFIREIKGLNLGAPELIYSCPAGSYGEIIFSHDENRLVFSETPDRHSPYSIFELNLTTSNKRRVAQPELYLGGNSQFNLHPTENKLLISSPDAQQWEGFYALDLNTDQLELLFKQDAYICCGIWDHSGERVVLMGDHPAYQLLSYDQHGGDVQVVYSGGLHVLAPTRHSNGKDYLFPATDSNRDAYFYRFESENEYAIANSTVNDFLARQSPNGQRFAFISIASGSEEIWIKEQDQAAKLLTSLNHSRHYVDLLWSYDGTFLLALTLNEIHRIDAQTGAMQRLNIPQTEIRGISLKNKTQLAFSAHTDQGWRVHYYDLSSGELTQANEKWKYIRYAQHLQDTLWQDQRGKLYAGAEPLEIINSELTEVSLLNGRSFNIAKVGNTWAWLQGTSAQHHLMLKKGAAEAFSLVTLSSHDFSLTEFGVVYHKNEKQKGDIYRTVSD